MLTNKYTKLFEENVVMTMENLMSEIGRPRESILRDLKAIGYYSSYNARGKFYTLCNTPVFDDLGLWKFRCAYFSIRRTLLDTAEYLINVSEAGCTHDELRQMLDIGIHNSLLQLTTAGRIERRLVGNQYVYFRKDNTDGQFKKRSTMPVKAIIRKTVKIRSVQDYPNMEPSVVIDILVAVLRGHDTDSEALSYLSRTGSLATLQQVTTVFRHYDIRKKNSTNRK